MAEQEVSASRQEVEQFVGKLRDFHGSLSTSEQAMLDRVLTLLYVPRFLKAPSRRNRARGRSDRL